MKKLYELVDCDLDILVKGIKVNSKDVNEGDLFVCIKGITADRHDYIDEAIERGASALIVSHEVNSSIPYVIVGDPNKELNYICAKFYDHPEEKLKIIGITGTDGKTSVTTIIQTLIGKDKCGIIGTNGYNCAKFNKSCNNTTPSIDKLMEYFSEFVDAGCRYVTMEASSEGFYNKRLETINFDTSAYTNITSEHLNVHKTIENYILCKANLFKQTTNFCILNKDDEHFNEMKKNAKNYLTYGKDNNNDLQIVDYKIEKDKTLITYKYKEKEYNITSPLLGDFNVYNLACALLTLLSMGFEMDNLIKNIKNINISGRLDFINLGQNFSVMVDYAHTPNGIYNLLKFVHTLDINRSIVVIGQAGERDKIKRSKVGEVVLNNASYAIFTYEDPRSENPIDICKDIVSTSPDKTNYEIVIDRKEAIKKAINIAEENDIVLILGKGNETYQKLKNQVIYFNDIEEAKEALEELMKQKIVTK